MTWAPPNCGMRVTGNEGMLTNRPLLVVPAPVRLTWEDSKQKDVLSHPPPGQH